MNYAQTLEFLFSKLPAYHRIGKAAYKNNLDNSIALDEYFGHPHLSYKTIHIAGTNGKGSVSHIIASVLQESGLKTGLFTSPHLRDFRERIRVNGKMIPKGKVTEFVRKHKSIIESVAPSFFEMTSSMAFDFFREEHVDAAVIEVGLGGRLDSTNIIKPVISVITNIGHDHLDLLGGTIEKVAAEKAGIMKKNIPVVIGETQNEIADIFLHCADESGSELFFADRGFSCSLKDPDDNSGKRHYFINDLNANASESGIIPLGGDYQEKNLQTVFQTFRILKGSVDVSGKNLRDGIRKVVKNTGLKGRWQILSHSPLTICDTGHNKEGLEYIMRQIKRIDAKNMHIIIGFVNDKDLGSILPLFLKDAIYYFTKATVPRAMNETDLQGKASGYGLTGKCYPFVNEALKAAQTAASANDLIFIGGSTFIVAEVV